jgi:hypothetical protein
VPIFKVPPLIVNGEDPNNSRPLVRLILPNTVTEEPSVKVFIFLLVGITASSVLVPTLGDGVKLLTVKLYKPNLAVGAVATVVNVPPAVVAEVVPTPQVGAATYP